MEKILFVDQLTIEEKETKKHVLSNVTFDVKNNSCLGIFGPSGSGKTTLLTTIMQICHPSLQTTGEIRYVTNTGIEQIIQTKDETNKKIKLSYDFSFIPQNAIEAFDPIEKMGKQLEETFIENQLDKVQAKQRISTLLKKMELPESILTKYPLDKVQAKQRISTLLKKMELPESILTKYPFQLSGGTLQRCAIGLAIEMRTKVIIADEPTSSLDSLNKKKIVDLFFELKKNNQTTILIATHDIEILDFLSDEVLVMVDGKKVEQKETNPLDENDQTYLGAIRKKNRKISAPFWRLKNEKMARS
ncbi:ATP-binding cassette domain-containing protein [Candidatus Enterococcus ferrettii]|uniref:Nickel transport system ATP-binding protein n=1 Tax=Candidatus Enterococcus ferrettii TaxID=2815324 RepID=A0ABV0EPU4_9ENTE|nr:ATP-binding cassette domain-containing protein [Enterococcus sp. 665A]MBO1342593.1 ATP-binding cassette domain-containing protein [Enterococcus sp. 665A]